MVAPGHRLESSAGAVRFLGRVDDPTLAQLYAGAEATLVASHVEGFGLPVLESMMCGAPVVAADILSLRQICGDAALFVDPRDPRGLREALEALIAEPYLRKDFAERAQRRAADYSIGRAARSYRRLYERLTGDRPRLPGRDLSAEESQS